MIKSLTLLLPFFGSFVAQAAPQAAAPQVDPQQVQDIPGYTIVPMAWEFETSPGGPTVVLNGTVEEAYAQLLKINPEYETVYGTIEENAAKKLKARESGQLPPTTVESRQSRD
ncbi:hypothetical protein QBC44DRAFT_365699 [Cladorrhinum sp. PSN332]|nr:hypothetical protein QBC44DRAFT_365699 [Cladorrhinum sp. PSN332]